MRNPNVKKKKQELKALASKIRSLKNTRKYVANGFVPELSSIQHDYRINHIAYCLFRGRSLMEIEGKEPEDLPEWMMNGIQDIINSDLEGWINEDVRASA